MESKNPPTVQYPRDDSRRLPSGRTKSSKPKPSCTSSEHYLEEMVKRTWTSSKKWKERSVPDLTNGNQFNDQEALGVHDPGVEEHVLLQLAAADWPPSWPREGRCPGPGDALARVAKEGSRRLVEQADANSAFKDCTTILQRKNPISVLGSGTSDI